MNSRLPRSSRIGRAVFPPLLLALAALRAGALDLELGAGAKIDIAPYGIENVTGLAVAAPWFRIADGMQAGLVAAASAGPAKADLEAEACIRVWPKQGAIALFDGAGALIETDLWPELVPMIIAGLRLGAESDAVLACVEVHYKPSDSDTMVWLAYIHRL